MNNAPKWLLSQDSQCSQAGALKAKFLFIYRQIIKRQMLSLF